MHVTYQTSYNHDDIFRWLYRLLDKSSGMTILCFMTQYMNVFLNICGNMSSQIGRIYTILALKHHVGDRYNNRIR